MLFIKKCTYIGRQSTKTQEQWWHNRNWNK